MAKDKGINLSDPNISDKDTNEYIDDFTKMNRNRLDSFLEKAGEVLKRSSLSNPDKIDIMTKLSGACLEAGNVLLKVLSESKLTTIEWGYCLTDPPHPVHMAQLEKMGLDKD